MQTQLWNGERSVQISQTWTRRIIFGPHRERFRWSRADQGRTTCFNLKWWWSWESTPDGSTTISKVAAQNRMQVIPRVMMNQVPNYHVICKRLSADIADCSRYPCLQNAHVLPPCWIWLRETVEWVEPSTHTICYKLDNNNQWKSITDFNQYNQ